MLPVLLSVICSFFMRAAVRIRGYCSNSFTVRNGVQKGVLGDRTPKVHLLGSCITESRCADDAAPYASSHKDFKMVASSFVAVAKLWGLTESLMKSKGMLVGTGADAYRLSPVPV